MNKFFNLKFIISVIFFFILIFIWLISVKFIDLKSNDIITKIAVEITNKNPSDNVVLVVVDKKSIEKFSWPWTKDFFSVIFDFLENEAKAKVIIYNDLNFFPDTYNPEKDTVFYENLKRQKKLINSYVFLNSAKTIDVLPEKYLKMLDSKSSQIKIQDRRTKKIPESYKGVIKLPKDFLYNVNNLAFSSITEDSDTIVRYYMPFIEMNNKFYPSLALSAYSMYSGIKSYILYDDFLCSYDDCKTLKMPIKSLKKKDYHTNVVCGVYSLINWYKQKNIYYSHKMYSASDIIDSYYAILNGKEPLINPDEFKNKIVIVGLNADGYVWEQISETPVMKKQADIDIQASFIDNMLSDSFKTQQKYDYSILITIIFSLFILRGFVRLKDNLFLAFLLSLVYFSYYIFEYINNVYIPPASPIIIIFSVVFLKKLFEIATNDKKSEMLNRVIGKYISKDVVKKLLVNPEKLHLGGVKAIVTVLFVDIRDFTSISEKLSAQEVTVFLNEYFSVIEPIIEKYHGIINKYIGDGVLAIFGEPIKDDMHALNALKCGMDIINGVKTLKEKLRKENKPDIDIGIGINTGEVFAGNIGTDERLEYTVIGDNVNLASRIEDCNQILKTQFLISSYTYEYIKNYVEVVKLSQVDIKGKSKPIDIYEVLKLKNVQ